MTTIRREWKGADGKQRVLVVSEETGFIGYSGFAADFQPKLIEFEILGDAQSIIDEVGDKE